MRNQYILEITTVEGRFEQYRLTEDYDLAKAIIEKIIELPSYMTSILCNRDISTFKFDKVLQSDCFSIVKKNEINRFGTLYIMVDGIDSDIKKYYQRVYVHSNSPIDTFRICVDGCYVSQNHIKIS